MDANVVASEKGNKWGRCAAALKSQVLPGLPRRLTNLPLASVGKGPNRRKRRRRRRSGIIHWYSAYSVHVLANSLLQEIFNCIRIIVGLMLAWQT